MNPYVQKIIFILTFFLNSTIVFCANWIDLNTGINDDLNGVVFDGNRGVVSGRKGIYVTSTGGIGPTSWSRFNITGNVTDSLLYNRTRFYHAYSEQYSDMVLACGMDTVNHTAVVFKIVLSSFAYSIPYRDSVGGCLKKIDYCAYQNRYFVVGDSGLVVMVNNTGSYTAKVTTNFTYDLTAISFSGTSSQFAMVGPGIYLRGDMYFNGLSINSITDIQTSNQTFSDVIYSSTSYYLAGSGYFIASPTLYEYGNYDFGALNATSIHQRGYAHYVGTDHGIFKSSDDRYFLEWQPSSLKKRINCFWSNHPSAAVSMYACGNNGVILSASGDGGVTKPFAKLTIEGGCKGGSVEMTAIKGTSTNCRWFVNGTLVNNSCTNFNRLFPTAGPQTIALYVANDSGYYDTATQVIQIVDPPKFVIPYTTNKKVLCKDEPIQITIDSSETNVFYTLRNYKNTFTYGSSPAGNGTKITFNGNVGTSNDKFYIRANSTVANCYTNFKDTFNIKAEHTKASFHKGLVNAKINEPVRFYQKCKDAKHYRWTFQNNALPGVSSDSTPVVRFGSLDSKVKLICWSDSGCYDTAETKGPKIYTELNHPDSFYSMVNKGPDPAWSGQYYPDISRMIPVNNGYVTSGFYNATRLSSYYGDSLLLPQKGGYIAKYNNDGTLKWSVFTKYTGNDQYLFHSVIENPKTGEIYGAGFSTGLFYDNAGDSFSVSGPFLVKLDSLGKLTWILRSSHIGFGFLSIDQSGNIVSASDGSVYNKSVFSINGIVSDSVSPSAQTYNGRILKISPSGKILWHAGIMMNYTNTNGLKKTGTDNAGNVYVTGSYEMSVEYYSPSGSLVYTLPGTPGNYGGRVFLVKYDSLGNFKWAIRSKTIGPPNERTMPHDMQVDMTGNIYLTGQNDVITSGYTQVFENTDSTITSMNAGPYFVAKITTGGKCLWIQGNSPSYYGWGYNLTLNNANELAVVGMVKNNSASQQTVTFTSKNNITIQGSFNSSDHFIAIYDTSGNIKRVLTNGANPSQTTDDLGFAGFFQKNNGAYYLARNIKFFNGRSNYKNFGTTIPSADGTDGFVAKFYENWRPDYASINSTNTITVNQCDSFYTPGNKLILSSGIYDDIIPNSAGGDSIIHIDLILRATKSIVSINGCDSATYRGQTYYASGNYRQTLPNSAGCDSTIYINADIPHSTNDTLYKTACDSFILNTITYKNSGWYSQKFISKKGCDSTITLNLDMRYTTYAAIPALACDSFTMNGITYKKDGVYTQKRVNSLGCDSIITLTLNITNDTSRIVVSGCDSVIVNAATYHTNGVYTQHLTSSFGCDSVVFVNVSLKHSDSTSVTLNVCGSFTLNGITYNSSGTYIQRLSKTNGCDSVIMLKLTIISPSFSTITASGCARLSYNGIHYDSSGIYNQKILNVSGCDSTITLDLTILKPSFLTIADVGCYKITFNGIEYDSSATYTLKRINANGCDSIITLNFTILKPTYSTITASGCNQLHFNGIVYDSSGIYTQTLTGKNGCDSIITLNLTILYSSNSTLNTKACKSVSVNNTRYTTSGTYQQLLKTVQGCDSVLTLNVSITNPDTSLSISGNTLTALADNVSYQWLNCTTGTIIHGATGKSYTPLFSGSFKLIVTDSGCSDTSSCHDLILTGITESYITEKMIRIYPNPNNGQFNLLVKNIESDCQLIITNIAGQEIQTMNIITSNQTLSLNLEVAEGLYFVKLIDARGTVIFCDKFVILNRN